MNFFPSLILEVQKNCYFLTAAKEVRSVQSVVGPVLPLLVKLEKILLLLLPALNSWNNNTLVIQLMYHLVELVAQRNHPAIDFIIYGSTGPVGTRVLYFIQVSSSSYQNRNKKLSAVTDLSRDLGNESPYKYYEVCFM